MVLYMKLFFDYDVETKKVVFFGYGFEISQKCETYEELANFAKCVIEHNILIPKLKYQNKEEIKLEIATDKEIFENLKKTGWQN